MEPPWTTSSTGTGGGSTTWYVTSMSAQARRADTTITITHNQTNRIAGFGILLPPRSMAPRIFCINPAGSAAGGGGAACSLTPPPARSGPNVSANRPKNSASTATAFSNSSRSTRSFGAWMLA